MQVEKLIEIIGVDFYTGVPDSQLKALCNYLMDTYGIDKQHHIIAANEGNCTGIAAGYHLSTGKVPVVYMQNSGLGNVINPIASLLSTDVYSIPIVFIIGWRGEPGIHDEPQHKYQGKVTLKLLEDMDIEYFVVDKDTLEDDVLSQMQFFKQLLKKGKSVAFVIRKGCLSYDKKVEYKNEYTLMREDIIRHIVEVSEEDPIICTTGKASRELFEIREEKGHSHKYDFLTVGSMGHSSSIAMGIAINKPSKKIWCIDGDGAVLMHMGALAVIGSSALNNFVHVIINNSAHETVGGMPSVAGKVSIVNIAKAGGYEMAVSVDTIDALDKVLSDAKNTNASYLIEVKSAIGARDDLGRPTTTANDNKENFMKYLNNI